MKKIGIILLMLSTFFATSCTGGRQQPAGQASGQEVDNIFIDTVTHSGLIIYCPNYGKIELICGERPMMANDSIIFCAGAAYTGKRLDDFRHSNIAGTHVSGGKLFRGYKCRRNTGAFIYHDGEYEFVYPDLEPAFARVAECGGMGFGQEMIIHEGEEVKHYRKNLDRNEFRALCSYNGKLCVIDSNGAVFFGTFVKNLLELGVKEALYMDMGAGWNYSWYRDNNNRPVHIHDKMTKHSTNWIVFYSK